MHTKLIFCITLLLGGQQLSAQVPGFRGKRAALQAGTNLSVRIPLEDFSQATILAISNAKIQAQPALHLQYIVTRHSVLRLSASMFKSIDTLAFKQFTYYNAPFSEPSQPGMGLMGHYYRDFQARVSQKTIAASYMVFTNRRNGALAPFGKYASAGFGIGLSKVLVDSTFDQISWEKAIPTNFLTFSLGNQQILYKRGIIDYGVSVNIVNISAFSHDDRPAIQPNGEPTDQMNRHNARVYTQWDLQKSTFITSYLNIGGIF